MRTIGTNLERNISNPGEKFTEFWPERTGNIPKEHEGYNLQEKKNQRERVEEKIITSNDY